MAAFRTIRHPNEAKRGDGTSGLWDAGKNNSLEAMSEVTVASTEGG